jgi:2'-5' RNA ligase
MSFFLAVDVDEAVRAQVAALIEAHRGATPASWLTPEKVHVTLLFLGEREPEGLEATVRAVASRFAPFSLGLADAGLFETARAPSVLWLGVTGQLEALSELRAAVVEVAGAQAPPAERERPYLPHLTLARGKRPGHFDAVMPVLRGFSAGPFVVRHVTLYESSHRVYTARWRAPLTAAGA